MKCKHRKTVSELAAMPLKDAVAEIKIEHRGPAKIFRDGTVRFTVVIQCDPPEAKFLEEFCDKLLCSRQHAVKAIVNRELIRSLTEIAKECEGT